MDVLKINDDDDDDDNRIYKQLEKRVLNIFIKNIFSHSCFHIILLTHYCMTFFAISAEI